MSYETIDSVEHPLALIIKQLLDAEGRQQLRQIIIDDIENIRQAMASGITIQKLISTDPEQLPSDLLSADTDIPIIALSKRTGKKLFGANKFSRDFVIAAMPQAVTLASINNSNNDIVALEDLKISGNIGAIIRTSTAFNTSAVVLLSDDGFDIYDRRLIRASRGLVFKLPVIATSAAEFLQFCQDNSIKVAVTSSHAAQDIKQIITSNERYAFVFGSEKSGASSSIAEHADLQLKIPLHNGVESLNVSVAAAVIAYLRSGDR